MHTITTAVNNNYIHYSHVELVHYCDNGKNRQSNNKQTEK